jgi:Ca2+-binding RTX toxin-like protein
LATANVLDDGQVYNITDCLIPIDNVVQIGTTPGAPGPNFTDLAGKNSLIVGTVAANNINAGDGDDLVFGLAGNDSITGGAGNDCLFGGAGDDTFFAKLKEAEFDDMQGGSDIDTLQITTTPGFNDLTLNQFLATNSIEQVNMEAGSFLHGIDGNDNDNVLDFSATTFFLSRNVEGGVGNDTITATNSATSTYDGNSGDDVLNGGSVADNLIGSTGNDTITGGGGNDTIVGGVGADSLTGGGGNDWFRYNATNEGTDTITDFVSGTDKFLFASLAFSNTASFNATGAAIGTNAQFIYNTGSGLLSYDSNGTLGGGSSNIAFLTWTPTLVGTDVLNFI